MVQRIGLAGALVLATVSSPVGDAGSPAVSQAPLVFTLTSPDPGAIVNVGTLVAADVSDDVPRDRIQSLTFEYSPDGVEWTPIEDVAPLDVTEFAVLWNVAFLANGDYVLRAVLVDTDAQIATTELVPVTVNTQPSASAGARSTAQRFRVLLDASASFDSDGSITRHEWDFGDGTTAEGATIEHTFPGAGAYGIAMTVRDDRGGEATADYILAMDPRGTVKFKRKEDCGCKKMTIKTSGPMEGPDNLNFAPEKTTDVPPAQQRTLGGLATPLMAGSTDQLDMTQDAFVVKQRFEVIVELQPNSKPQACREGQRVKRTSTIAGNDTDANGKKTSDPRYDSSKDPAGGADDPYDPNDDPNKRESTVCAYTDAEWCDDDYHGGGGADGRGNDDKQPPNLLKKYEGERRILWADVPGLGKHYLKKADLVVSGATYKAKFEAKVTGTRGDCACAWEIAIEINKEGKITRNEVFNITEACKP